MSSHASPAPSLLSTPGGTARRRRRVLALAAVLPVLALAGCSGPAELEWDAERAEAAVRAQVGEDAEVVVASAEEIREKLNEAPEGTDLLGRIPEGASQDCLTERAAYMDTANEAFVGSAVATRRNDGQSGLGGLGEFVQVFVYKDTAAREATAESLKRATQACELDSGDDADAATVQVEGQEAKVRRSKLDLSDGPAAISTFGGGNVNVSYNFQRVQRMDEAPSAQEYADERAEDAEQLLKDLRG